MRLLGYKALFFTYLEHTAFPVCFRRVFTCPTCGKPDPPDRPFLAISALWRARMRPNPSKPRTHNIRFIFACQAESVEKEWWSRKRCNAPQRMLVSGM